MQSVLFQIQDANVAQNSLYTADNKGRVRKVKIHHAQADRKIFYAFYGNNVVHLDPSPVSRARLTVVEPVFF